MPPEITGADPELVALGLPPSLEERIAAVLMGRYRDNAVLSTYLTTLAQVESEEILALAGESPAPAFYLALNGTDETPKASALATVITEWKGLLVAPVPADKFGPFVLSRSRIVQIIKSLTYGSVPGVIENDDDPDNPLAYRLVRWERVDAPSVTPGNATLRTLIGFQFESTQHVQTREIM